MDNGVSIDFYKRLAAEIIHTACTDYILALSCDDERLKSDCERFFSSQWCDFLSDNVDGQILMWRIKDCMRKFSELAKPYFQPEAADEMPYKKSVEASFRCPLCGSAVYVRKKHVTGFHLIEVRAKCGSCDAFRKKTITHEKRGEKRA